MFLMRYSYGQASISPDLTTVDLSFRVFCKGPSLCHPVANYRIPQHTCRDMLEKNLHYFRTTVEDKKNSEMCDSFTVAFNFTVLCYVKQRYLQIVQDVCADCVVHPEDRRSTYFRKVGPRKQKASQPTRKQCARTNSFAHFPRLIWRYY